MPRVGVGGRTWAILAGKPSASRLPSAPSSKSSHSLEGLFAIRGKGSPPRFPAVAVFGPTQRITCLEAAGALAMPYAISEEKRDWYRLVSARSRQRKKAAGNGELALEGQAVNRPRLKPEELMPQLRPHGLRVLSLFSGGGGLDLAFERAGYGHVASFDILEICGTTLRQSRPGWQIFGGRDGDVNRVDWSGFKGSVDLVHGGPPCQRLSLRRTCPAC